MGGCAVLCLACAHAACYTHLIVLQLAVGVDTIVPELSDSHHRAAAFYVLHDMSARVAFHKVKAPAVKADL